MKQVIHPRLEKTIIRMLCDSTFAFYGEFSGYINFFEDNSIPTAGVCIKNTRMNYYYNSKFIDSLTDEELMFLHIHELLHLLCNHVARTIVGIHDHHLANIFQDMIINTSIVESFKHGVKSIKNKITGDESGYFVPVEYKEPQIFEHLYEWMMDKKDKKTKSDHLTPAKNDGTDFNGDTVGDYVSDALNDESYSFDIHMQNDGDPEANAAIIKDIMSGIRARGINTSDVEHLLNKICPPKKNHIKSILSSISQMKGSMKVETITRPNRRGIVGAKGKKSQSHHITAILDVSGSMNGHLEIVLSQLFTGECIIDLIQCDTEVKRIVEIKSKYELSKMKICGLGGTLLQPAVDYAIDNCSNPLVVLTDGYTDTLNFSKYSNKVLVITCGVSPTTINNSQTKIIKL